jgi:hypothetical protein
MWAVSRRVVKVGAKVCAGAIEKAKAEVTTSGWLTFLRRIRFRPWYRVTARVGETGVDEYFLDPLPVPTRCLKLTRQLLRRTEVVNSSCT